MKSPKYLISRDHPQFEWVAYRLAYSVALESSRAFFYSLASFIGLEVYGLGWYLDGQLGAHIGMSTVIASSFGSNLSRTNLIEPTSTDSPCFHPAIPTTLMFSASFIGFTVPRLIVEYLIGIERVIDFVVDNVPEVAFLFFCTFFGPTYLYDKLFHKASLRGLPMLPGMWLSKMLADSLSNGFRKSIGKRRRCIGLSVIDQSTANKQYVYSAIGTRMIRLLKIEAIPGKLKAQCELVSVPLDKAPRYDAVSYCWGDPAANHSLLVDNMRIPITQSVHDLFLAFCPTEGTRYLWIDSISINQVNTTEKEHQIPLMGEIYEKANEVVVFLGSNDDSFRACNFAHCVVSHLLETVNINRDAGNRIFQHS